MNAQVGNDTRTRPAFGNLFPYLLRTRPFPLSKAVDASLAKCGSLPRQDQQRSGRKDKSLARTRYQQGSLMLRGKRVKKWVLRWREDVQQGESRVCRMERKTVLGTLAELPTRKLAQRRAEQVLARVNSPDYRAIKIATFAEFVELWRARVLSQRKLYTQKSANYHLRSFLLPKLGALRLDQIGLGEVQGLVSGMNVRRHSIMNAIGTLRSILLTARKWGYLAAEFRPADLVIPQQVARPARFFSPEQTKRIIESAKLPWKALYALGAMCGLRPGEALALTWDDITENEIHIRRSSCFGKLISTKTKGSASTVPLTAPLRAILDDYRKVWKPNPEHLLFATRNGRPYTTNKVSEYFLHPLLKELGISQCGLNGFRHTHASLLLTAGASPMTAQRQLRHSDALTTLRNYAHVIGLEQREVADKVSDILRPSSAKGDSQVVATQ